MAAVKTSPLIAIVGPTASGKTALALEIAQELNGEIVCADSRTLYKGLPIGTAQPSLAEQQLVRHWGIDLLAPDERFSAAQFQEYTNKAIADIRTRGKTPILVGGTGLYIDAVLFDYQFAASSTLSAAHNPDSENDDTNTTIYIANSTQFTQAINRSNQFVQRSVQPVSTSIIVGIATNKTMLRERIAQRIDAMLEQGVVAEAINTADRYGWNCAAMSGNIYQLIRRYQAGELAYHQIAEQSRILDWRLAKRQMTWFRRNPYITWCDQASAPQLILDLDRSAQVNTDVVH